MNYERCHTCVNFLGCALGNEEVFEGDNYALEHCSDHQKADEEDI